VKNKPVDIIQECAALFTQEDTLAWFDFHYDRGEGPAAEGLCRIAHPKKSACGRDYVSLVFVMDTPDASGREQAVAGLKRLGSGMLETMLPEIFSVVSVPPASCSRQIYIKQFDLMLKEMFTASREFIGRRLHPALADALSLSAGELAWWEDMRKEKPSASAQREVAKKRPKSLMVRLQEKLFDS
jgi:hypothetical protein